MLHLNIKSSLHKRIIHWNSKTWVHNLTFSKCQIFFVEIGYFITVDLCWMWHLNMKLPKLSIDINMQSTLINWHFTESIKSYQSQKT